MSDHTTSSVVTVTQKIGLTITGGGLSVSFVEQITQGFQLIGAVTGAIAGCWVLWDRWQGKKKSRRTKS